MKIGNDVNLCKLCLKRKEQGNITVSSPWNTSKRWRCERKWRLELNSSQVDILSPFLFLFVASVTLVERTEQTKFDLCIPHVPWPPTESFKGVELFDHILRRGGYFFFESQRGKRWDGGKNNTSTRWHIQIKNNQCFPSWNFWVSFEKND